MSFELILDTPRGVPTPYPILRAGLTKNSTPIYTNHYFQDRVEICVRLAAEEEFAEDSIDGERYRTPFPHLFFKYPFHRVLNSYSTFRNAIHFSYSLATLERLRADGILPQQEYFFLPFKMNDEIRHLVRRFTELLNHTLERRMLERLDLAAFELLTECLMTRVYPEQNSSGSTDKLLSIASILRQSFQEYPDFAELAKRHGMSLRTLFRHWSDYFGTTPARFVQELKVAEAARLLRESSMPIGAVAAAVALGDASYFSKIFRRHLGMTPGKYRKHMENKEMQKTVSIPPARSFHSW